MASERDKELPFERSRYTSHEPAYSIEARNEGEPIMVAGKLIDERWREIHPDLAKHGVPPAPKYHEQTVICGLFGYQAAQALCWWLHAAAAAESSAHNLQTRLVEHEVTMTRNVTTKKIHDTMDTKP